MQQSPFFRCQQGLENPIPSGSPISPEFWTNITVNNLHDKSCVTGSILDSNQSSSNAIIKLPKSLKLNGFTQEAKGSQIVYVDRFLKRDEGFIFKLSDSNIDTLLIIDNANTGQKCFATLNGCRGFDDEGITIANKTDGFLTVIDSKTKKYREFTGGWSAFSPTVKFIGGSVENTSDAVYFEVQTKANHRISALNTSLIYGDENAMRGDLHLFKPINCSFNGSERFAFYIGGGSANTASINIPLTMGACELIIQNSAGKIDTVVIDSNYSTSISLPNVAGTIATTVGSTNTTVVVDAPNLFRVWLA